MDYVLLAIVMLVPVSVIFGPVATMAWTTVRRIRKFNRSGRKFKFQYQISDLLTATFCLGVPAAMLQEIFHGSSNELLYTAYFIAATSLGILAGKIWHQSTITNSLKDGPTYIIVGAVLWILASVVPAFGLYLINSGILPSC